jgi:hypothetical protein
VLAQHVGLAHMYAIVLECAGRSEVFCVLCTYYISWQSCIAAAPLMQHRSQMRSVREGSPACLVQRGCLHLCYVSTFGHIGPGRFGEVFSWLVAGLGTV